MCISSFQTDWLTSVTTGWERECVALECCWCLCLPQHLDKVWTNQSTVTTIQLKEKKLTCYLGILCSAVHSQEYKTIFIWHQKYKKLYKDVKVIHKLLYFIRTQFLSNMSKWHWLIPVPSQQKKIASLCETCSDWGGSTKKGDLDLSEDASQVWPC